MKVWIDQDLCTGDGLCGEICPDVFVLMPDGVAYVRDESGIMAASEGSPQGYAGMVTVKDQDFEFVAEAAEECPGECISVEADSAAAA